MKDILTEEERQSLTFVGTTISAQIRGPEMALYVFEDAPRSSENGHPVMVDARDTLKLCALLQEARGRFELMPEYKYEGGMLTMAVRINDEGLTALRDAHEEHMNAINAWHDAIELLRQTSLSHPLREAAEHKYSDAVREAANAAALMSLEESRLG